MQWLKTYCFALVFFFATTAAYAGNYYSQVWGNLSKGKIVTTTRTAESRSAQLAMNARREELTGFGVELSTNKFLAGSTYDQEFGAMFEDQPGVAPYLSMQDRHGREVRVTIEEVEPAEALELLTLYQEKYKGVKAKDLKIIQPVTALAPVAVPMEA